MRLSTEPTSYSDTPDHGHNYDTVQVRVLNAAWNALYTREPTDLSFAELAREAGITTGAIYPYFPNVSFLVADVIGLGFKTLFRALGKRFHPVFDRPTAHHWVRVILSDFLRFAEKRPRHAALMLSKQYAHAERFPAIAAHHRELQRVMDHVLLCELRHPPTGDERHEFWAILLGAVAVAGSSNRQRRKVAFAAFERFFRSHRAEATVVAPSETAH